ncbi:head decoration protein [Oceanospirillum sediminis]|uniref:Head decoration protein n=1 Tax=Oceanospirillum sediminis TaxID=2760088 RepID=A0A839IWQ1_9GAMM|nr:head decoration protein [Oceanospirillum sediminis]MBB1489391.1 head decoration protein [Oceanospirillum sediminis]
MEYFVPKNWVTGSEQVHTTEGRLAAGQQLAEHAPLGQNQTTGEYHLWDPSASDGTQLATRIAPQYLDSSSGAVSVQLIKNGIFNPDEVAWPDGTTEAQKLCAFSGTPISLQKPL